MFKERLELEKLRGMVAVWVAEYVRPLPSNGTSLSATSYERGGADGRFTPGSSARHAALAAEEFAEWFDARVKNVKKEEGK